MSRGSRLRVPALVVAIVVLLAVLSIPASAAGPKRIFITKYDENFMGQANVTFELYEDTDGDGVRDDGEPLLQTKVTDAAGKATFDPVKPGKYIVHEVTPAGYVDNPDKGVEVPDAKGPGPQIVFSNTPKPTEHRVNDPTGDTSFDDGTHVFDFGPTIAQAPNGDVVVIWNDTTGFNSPGGVSGTGSAISIDFGQTFEQLGKLPPGSSSEFVLGEPTVIFDPVHDRFIAASDSFVATPGGVTAPILVHRSGGLTNFWQPPVNTFPAIGVLPTIAHGPSLRFDPISGRVYLAFTRSNADGTSEPMVTTSNDGGATWRTPVSVTGPGGHFDFVNGAVGPNGTFHATWGDYSSPDVVDILISSSTDNGRTWTPERTVAVSVPRAGTPNTCEGSGQRTVLGSIFASERPQIVVSPLHPNRIFVAFNQHGVAGDESDVVVTQSNDGGQTWSDPTPVGPTEGTQFNPVIDVTPDGRVGVATYSAEEAGIRFLAVFVLAFGTIEAGAAAMEMLLPPMPFFPTNPSFDTDIANCHGVELPAIAAPGSGFFMAWTDTRDPGPAGNNGVDPNIYFAHTEGPRLSTELSLSVKTTASKLNVSGKVTPMPLPGAKVIVTLFLDTGDGFDQVGKAKKPSTGKGGSWSTTFARPVGGTCKITVVFEGSEGRDPSPSKSKTFAC